MDLGQVFRQKEREGDVRSADGLLICGVCGKPKERHDDALGFPVKVLCECEQKQHDARMAEEAAQAQIQDRQRVKEWVRRCFCDLGPGGVLKAEKMTFDNDVLKDSSQSESCRKYADRFEWCLRDDLGLVLHGPVGTGKTFLASCICNSVIEKGFTARFLNLSDIAQRAVSIKEAEREEARDAIMTPDLIVFDDLGVERRSEYMDEAVYTAVNTRYMANKPAIFTTNLKADDIGSPKDEMQKRIFSRIVGMCDFVPVEGKDMRIGEHNFKRRRAKKTG